MSAHMKSKETTIQRVSRAPLSIQEQTLLLAALQFYADAENWKEIETGIGMFPGEAIDYGAKARAVLSNLKI